MYMFGDLKDGMFVKGFIANKGHLDNAMFCDYGEGCYYTTLEYVTKREVEEKVGLFKTVTKEVEYTRSYEMVLRVTNNCTQVEDLVTGDIFDIASSSNFDSPKLQIDVTGVRSQHEVAAQLQKMDQADISKYREALSLVKRDVSLLYEARNKESQEDAEAISNFCRKMGR